VKKSFLTQPVVMTSSDRFYPTAVPTFFHNPAKGSDLPIFHEINRSIVSFMQRDSRLLDMVLPKWLNFII